MLVDNINILTERFPKTYKILKEVEKSLKDSENSKVLIEETRNNLLTISVEQNDKRLYIHSKYNPLQEAERFVEQFKEIEKYKHVFFYGVGLGYHIEAFLKQHPGIEFTLFEPNPEILYQFLSNKKLSHLPIAKLKEIVTEISPQETTLFLIDFADFIIDDVLFIGLPSYERIFEKHYKSFINLFRNILLNKRYALNTNMFYEKKWTINCLKNFEQIINTPNFFDGRGKYFTGKPGIIVAAGPSLEEEIENLRYIKENGLGYIFAAGSGLHPLLNNGIIPDAACSYDPNDNTIVFNPIFEKQLDSIPLIFGSFVGLSRLGEYPGSKFHIIVSQDTIAPYYLKKKNGKDLNVIIDSPTISGILLQLLDMIGCNPIIFVGQNLAFKDKMHYASGIKYYNPNISEAKLKEAVLVEDVYGGQVLTNDSFRLMKNNLEYLIKNHISGRELINTTKGGAKINGTKFIPLETLLKEGLTESVVDRHWIDVQEDSYEAKYMVEQEQKMENYLQCFAKNISNIEEIFNRMKKLINYGNIPQLQKSFNQFDKELKKLFNNRFYQVFIAPMKKVELELLAKIIDKIKFDNDPVFKAQKIIKDFGNFINGCKRDFEVVKPYYLNLKDTILNKANSSDPKIG